MAHITAWLVSGGAALRRVHRGGVGQGEVLGDVGGREHHALTDRLTVRAGLVPAGVQRDVEAAVVADAR